MPRKAPPYELLKSAFAPSALMRAAPFQGCHGAQSRHSRASATNDGHAGDRQVSLEHAPRGSVCETADRNCAVSCKYCVAFPPRDFFVQVGGLDNLADVESASVPFWIFSSEQNTVEAEQKMEREASSGRYINEWSSGQEERKHACQRQH
ncbi:hypothetical protein CH063_05858 [Colletotrichum higginsianum]|uniref:Uncharacterized protein n=1 Tax=Colletotrichum higginsianum (strain IMI 349063) TaxID=759273 RepID=H1V0H4_COLHI|nr:hypothetical protein CH063_05858 [Colletotrichum higginsianum]